VKPIPSPAHAAPGASLSDIVRSAASLSQIRRSDLAPGDWLAVKTSNSLYTIRVLGNEAYEIAGGWFSRTSAGTAVVRISGCTWGGSSIKTDIVAACGLRLEFGNRVRTSPIGTIVHVPFARMN